MSAAAGSGERRSEWRSGWWRSPWRWRRRAPFRAPRRRGTCSRRCRSSSRASTSTTRARCWRAPRRWRPTTRAWRSSARGSPSTSSIATARRRSSRGPRWRRSTAIEVLADIAHGCQRVTAALAGVRDDDRGIEVRWQDEHDAPLGPLLFDTVAAARDTLTRDLGVDWPRPTRVVVVRDLLSLSAMTGLPYESAQTTGTVAVAKWGRVTLLSPRASRPRLPVARHGRPRADAPRGHARDRAIARRSGSRRESRSARRSAGAPRAPFDDRPPPDVVVARGIEHGLGLPLDKLGPSIAMLPSADAAMVAFAEVTSFVRFYAETVGRRSAPGSVSRIEGRQGPERGARRRERRRPQGVGRTLEIGSRRARGGGDRGSRQRCKRCERRKAPGGRALGRSGVRGRGAWFAARPS